VAPVVQKMDSARFIQWIMQLVSELLIHWIVIYLVDSVIKLLNNRDKLYPKLVDTEETQRVWGKKQFIENYRL